jgi:hypothetical protein
MGISLRDFGNFAVGAIERDREITKEDLAIKADELTANRDFLIKQKEKKYDKELEQYYKEKEKFDTINQANKMYDLKSIDARTYAATILPITNPNWKNLDEKTKQLNINNFDGKTIDYKLIGNPEEISKQAALINNKINSVTSEAIKNAKGDRFLINKILGQKKKAEADLLEEVENKIKAADAVKMSEQNVNQEYVGKDVKVSSSNNSLKSFLNETNSDKYQTEWSKQRDKISYNPLKDEEGIRFLNTAANLGGSDELSFKYNAKDQKISGLNAPAFAFADSMKYLFNHIKDSNDSMVSHYYNVTPLHGNIGRTWNEENIYKQVESIISDRSGNIKEDPVGFGGNIRLTTIVPASIVPINVKLEKESLQAINQIMNKYILDETKRRYKAGEGDNKTYQQVANNVYAELYRGDNKNAIENIITSYNKMIPNNQEKTNVNNESSSDAPPPPKSNYKLSPNKDSFVIDGSEVTFDSVLKNNEEDKLPSELVGPYNEWKSKQNNSENKKVSKGTTYEDIQKNTQATNKKIKDSFTNFSQNMKNMKSNTQYGNQNPLKSS